MSKEFVMQLYKSQNHCDFKYICKEAANIIQEKGVNNIDGPLILEHILYFLVDIGLSSSILKPHDFNIVMVHLFTCNNCKQMELCRSKQVQINLKLIIIENIEHIEHSFVESVPSN